MKKMDCIGFYLRVQVPCMLGSTVSDYSMIIKIKK